MTAEQDFRRRWHDGHTELRAWLRASASGEIVLYTQDLQHEYDPTAYGLDGDQLRKLGPEEAAEVAARSSL